VTVLDASAVLAYLQGESGSDVVERSLDGAAIGAANWSEVLARLGDGIEARLADAVLVARGVTVEPVSKQDAELGARLRGAMPALSLGDRLCLALGERLDAVVLTADRAWADGGRVTQIR
jgi:PIN domain nuclease of toxin-antitoxin system